MNLVPVPTSADWEMALVRTPPDPNGAFRLNEIVPARYRIDVQGLPAGWVLATAIFDGRDAADHQLVLEAGREYQGGVLKFTNRTGEITGALANALNAPVAGQTIVVFPEDRNLWLPQSRRIRIAVTGADGRYAFSGLIHGEYRLAAVSDLEAGQQADRGFLSQLLAGSIAVTLGEGERKMQDIKTR